MLRERIVGVCYTVGMNIEVEANPNCEGTDQFVYKELGKPRPVRAIRVAMNGRDVVCPLTGVDAGCDWVQAMAVKIADSSDAFAYLIYGGRWGIRIRPEGRPDEIWDLKNKAQWGEPYKIYGSEEDIIYES